MINPSKAFRRLGMVAAAGVVGFLPLALTAGTASAQVTGGTLTASPSVPGSASTVTDSFVTGAALEPTNSITITSETVPPGCVIGLPPTPANYTVTFTLPGTTTPIPVTSTATPGGVNATCASGTPSAAYLTSVTSAVINLGSAIPSGSTVTVTITGAQNPPVPSTVYFNNSTTEEPAPISTGVFSIANPTTPVVTPTVTSVNPTAYTDAGGQPFTIMGTNFFSFVNATTPSPVVCFVESTTTPPPVSTTTPAGNPCAAPVTGTGGLTGVVTSAPALTITGTTATEIQGTSPVLTPGHNYNVVVYNFNPGATTPTYTAASATSSATLVGVAHLLNVVPESGVRIVDSRSAVNLPMGPLTPGTPATIPLTAFNQSLQLPTNLPASGVTGVYVNVTAVAPASGGNIQVWTQAGACPNGVTNGVATKPATVNFQPPQDTNNAQLIPVVAGATNACIQDNGAPVNVVADLVGYTTSGSGFTASNTRLLDTRPSSHVGSLLGPLASNTVFSWQTGLSGGTLVALNVAAVAPSAPGNLRVAPEPTTGPAVPSTALNNYIVGTDASAMLITTVPASGILDLYSDMGGTPGTVNVVVDELGTLVAATSSLHSLAAPVRIFDSRPGPIPAGGTVTVVGSPSGSGTNFVPAGALGLVGNLSDITPAGQGFLVTFPAGGVVPGTASIAHFPAQTRNTNNMVALNPGNGSFSIFNSGAATNTTFDASGYITNGAAPVV